MLQQLFINSNTPEIFADNPLLSRILKEKGKLFYRHSQETTYIN